MNKETSSRVSTIASRLVHTTGDTIVDAHSRGFLACQTLAEEIRTLAGSCMSQDETAGQFDRSGANRSLQEIADENARKPAGDFHTRLKDEREDLDRRLTALNSFLTHNPGKPSPRHNLMLVEQARLMSELLAVIDERLCDIGITERSAPVLAVDNGENVDGE